MNRLHLPAKYRGMSLHIWCITCKKPVTAAPCKHGEQQRFQSRVYNPITQTTNYIKSHSTRDVEEAIKLHLEYQAQLKANNYHFPGSTSVERCETPKPVFLNETAKMYLDYLMDIDVPAQEKKNLTREYIADQTRYITRFLSVVKMKVNRIAAFPVTSVTRDHISDFYKFLKRQNYTQRSYNAHMQSVKYFFNYVIRDLKIAMDNPLENVKMQAVHYDPEVISPEEFELFVSGITEKNGTGIKGSKGTHKVDYYRPWLKKVFILSLLIGERLDGVVLLRWSHIDGDFFKIPNFKVNRIQKVDKYYSYTPITADLAELLLRFEMTGEDAYIVAPEFENRYSLKKFVSKAFTHFWRVTGLKGNVSFKTLRKTYETRLTSVIGSKAMFVKHNSDKTAIKHYLDKKELLEAAKDVRLYDISSWF